MGAAEAWERLAGYYLLLLATVRSDSHRAEMMGERRIRRRLERRARSVWPWVRMLLCARQSLYRRAWVLARGLVATTQHHIEAAPLPTILGEVFVRRHSGRRAAAATARLAEV